MAEQQTQTPPTPEQRNRSAFDLLGTPTAPALGTPTAPVPGTSTAPVPANKSAFDLLGTPAYDRASQDPNLAITPVPVSPALAEKATAIAAGTATGFPLGLTVSGATVEGARLASKISKNPYVVATGGVLGFGAGMVGAMALDPYLKSMVPPRYLQDPALIPYFEGGRTLGETLGAAPTLFRVPEVVGGRVANYMSSIGTEARKAPIRTLMFEGSTGLTAGTAGAMSLAYDPSNEGLRMVAETVSGVINPLHTIQAAGSTVKSVLGRFGEAGRENKAAQHLQRIIEQAGDDPQELIRLLLEPLPQGVPAPTSGQKTGSLALLALENTLAKQNPAFGAQLGPQGMQTFEALQNMVDQLRDIGDPAALAAAAQIESNVFQRLLSNRLAVAEQNAAETLNRIGPRDRLAPQVVGRTISEEVLASLDDARAYSDALWKQAELETLRIDLGQSGLSDAVVTPRRLRAENSSRGMLEAMTSVSPDYFRSMPGASTARRIAGRFGVTPDSMQTYKQGKFSIPYVNDGKVPETYVTGVTERNVGDMVQARSDLLRLARVHAPADPTAARVYGEMAEAIYADMDTLKFPAYERARLYTKELHDFYSRTFAGDMSATDRTGALTLVPEVLVQRAFGSYTDVTYARMDQAIASVKGLDTRYQRLLQELGPDHPQVLELKPFAERAAQGATSMRDAQQQWLLLGAQKSFNETIDAQGRAVITLNKAKLDKFIVDNRPYLAAAGLLGDLRDASTAEATLRQVMDANSAFNKGVKDQAAFAIVLGNKNINPIQTVRDALNSDNPVVQMRRLMTLARNAPDPKRAVEGLQSIVYDYAFTAAGGNRRFSPTAYYETLFEPLNGIRNKPSLTEMMQRSGVMSSMEVQRLQQLIRPMRLIEESLQSNAQLDALMTQPKSAVEELAVSYLGSKLGTSLSTGSAQSLVLAGRGASIARDMLLNKPSMLIQDILQAAARDPQKMATLLTKITTKNQQDIARRLAAQYGGSLFTIGIAGGAINPTLYEEVEQAPRDPYSTPYDQMYTTPKSLPPAPQTRGLPSGLGGAPAAQAPTAAPPGLGAAQTRPAPQVAPDPRAREMLNQLFPPGLDSLIA